MPSTSTRREVLAGLAAGSASLAGCSGLLRQPEFAASWGGTLDQPLIADESALSNTEFYAALVTSRREATEKLDRSAFSEAKRSEWKRIDYSSLFLAAFISTRQVLPPGHGEGWCPHPSIEGGDFVFRLNYVAGDWPPMATGPNGQEYFTHLERWRLHGSKPPRRALAEVRIVPSAPSGDVPASEKVCGSGE